MTFQPLLLLGKERYSPLLHPIINVCVVRMVSLMFVSWMVSLLFVVGMMSLIFVAGMMRPMFVVGCLVFVVVMMGGVCYGHDKSVFVVGMMGGVCCGHDKSVFVVDGWCLL